MEISKASFTLQCVYPVIIGICYIKLHLICDYVEPLECNFALIRLFTSNRKFCHHSKSVHKWKFLIYVPQKKKKVIHLE